MAKEGSTVSGLMDSLATTRQRGAPVRRAAARPRQQVRPRPVRAERLHRQPGDPDRQVDRRLHLPLARARASCPRRAPRSWPDRRAKSPTRPFAGSGIRPWSAPSFAALAPRAADPVAPPKATAVAEDAPDGVARRSPPATSLTAVRRRHRPTAMATPTGTATATGTRSRSSGRSTWAPPGSLRGPGGLAQLRRLRLDHGPQRQLLQVPQLRQHERLQLGRPSALIRARARVTTGSLAVGLRP